VELANREVAAQAKLSERIASANERLAKKELAMKEEHTKASQE
jgi:hypothetical protein